MLSNGREAPVLAGYGYPSRPGRSGLQQTSMLVMIHRLRGRIGDTLVLFGSFLFSTGPARGRRIASPLRPFTCAQVREDGLPKLLVRGLHPLPTHPLWAAGAEGGTKGAADWVSVSRTRAVYPPPEKPGHVPAEKTVPPPQSRLGRAPVGHYAE
jgi:hypothetical protein